MKDFGTLIVRGGVNVQPGQLVIINSPIECAVYARDIMKAAYEAGAGDCLIQWKDEESARIRYDYASCDALSVIPEWMTESRMYYARNGACFITIASEDPDIFAGVDPMKIRTHALAANKAYGEYWNVITQNQCTWCVVSAPNPAWACKMFPNVSKEQALTQLEEAIEKTMRLDREDPVAALSENNRLIAQRAARLNALQFKTLRYRNQIGTDFTVDLPENHIWQGGAEPAQNGVIFTANIPTEEIYTAPDYRTANGTLVSAMPLCHQGRLVEHFTLTFKDGVLTDYTAESGREVLENIFSADPGAARLGEVALVEKCSPIAQMNLLFYNTLFDENASCHFAVGSAYPSCIEGGLGLSDEALLEKGVNCSDEHVDFMIGTADLEITGILPDGRELPIFVQGNFCL
ncbi:MAG: aminopeptidase [Clostridia bacterium]|nr:aminopeptidase [Clostridia bacterium]